MLSIQSTVQPLQGAIPVNQKGSHQGNIQKLTHRDSVLFGGSRHATGGKVYAATTHLTGEDKAGKVIQSLQKLDEESMAKKHHHFFTSGHGALKDPLRGMVMQLYADMDRTVRLDPQEAQQNYALLCEALGLKPSKAPQVGFDRETVLFVYSSANAQFKQLRFDAENRKLCVDVESYNSQKIKEAPTWDLLVVPKKDIDLSKARSHGLSSDGQNTLIYWDEQGKPKLSFWEKIRRYLFWLPPS